MLPPSQRPSRRPLLPLCRHGSFAPRLRPMGPRPLPHHAPRRRRPNDMPVCHHHPAQLACCLPRPVLLRAAMGVGSCAAVRSFREVATVAPRIKGIAGIPWLQVLLYVSFGAVLPWSMELPSTRSGRGNNKDGGFSKHQCELTVRGLLTLL
ncbi:uncharacterized protein LOC110433430 isoform X2 [Sorghum bicolor]|uniref:uncharacterized protein LOC110433430 isoform X2 n=1 Tax=Sorghum bicolor TaxID=4558 RepID=UPI000B426468|nr:uncharacterized protein LOC110433430 isoform X2 [Sorghum bicolor]|eukprot:XP_021311236.1 uncharacterized protein LOC110433430 isoform X2 [Sorghum bicolor]